MPVLCLASGSEIRAELLRNAHVPFEVAKARIDEETARHAMQAEGLSPRDISDHLAELKALRVSARAPEKLVLGCDQILELDGTILTKPADSADACEQILRLSGREHRLHSAAVLAEDNRPVWRFTETVRMKMRTLSESYVDSYVTRNWDQIRYCVGAYQLESEGVRFFERVDGDFFSVLGLPLLPLLDHLALRGVIET
ncbi:Maf family protein [Aliiruegeria lutimaris]|uniref:Nucleoside triphosphate pyrophosphatase n=1 Tax=Aliiruegeria lutimaris TaxID=571298 RepID=A0A1G8ND74_9RHOB|nr:nucleoside triphosphate pyrophosphatase [Aliiruegeria lutimaris]SDI78017.1 septum formation protein [Aliiruegeria lutimaris]